VHGDFEGGKHLDYYWMRGGRLLHLIHLPGKLEADTQSAESESTLV
jgi:hypothetical protein